MHETPPAVCVQELAGASKAKPKGGGRSAHSGRPPPALGRGAAPEQRGAGLLPPPPAGSSLRGSRGGSPHCQTPPCAEGCATDLLKAFSVPGVLASLEEA